MAPQTIQITERDRWRISRQFQGDRDPEALLRALIQAHLR